jgi:hypothetical protein
MNGGVHRVRKLTVVLVAVCAAGLAAFVFRSWWLTEVGYALTGRPGQKPGIRAEAILLPTADQLISDSCTSVLAQAVSLSEGYGRAPIYMTCTTWYGVTKCELAIAAAARDGKTIALREIETSELPDKEEAELALRKLREAGIARVAVILPACKAGRLGTWYQEVASKTGMEARIVPSACGEFDARTWWKDRQQRKLAAYELVRWIVGY